LEYDLALERIAHWRDYFPKARVCIGNHDERVIRLAASVNIPAVFIRRYAEVWDTPKWTWDYEFILDDVYYFHGTGHSGVHPAYNVMGKMLMSTVMGHIHTASGVKWKFNPLKRIFGMDVGCGIDERSLAFAYGKHLRQRSGISAGVVLEGDPIHTVCKIGRGEKYHRSRFTKGARCSGRK
jgi:hypothetical protein